MKQRLSLGEGFHLHGNIKGKASERVVPKEEWPSVRNSLTWKHKGKGFTKM